ncbi:MAG: hypothetical protein AB1656_25455 [Candidatus Omnitrophota bacterium]
MNTELSALDQWLIDYGFLIIVLLFLMLVVIVVGGYWLIRLKLRMMREAKSATVWLEKSGSLLDLVEQTRKENPRQTLNVVLGQGDFSVEKEMVITSPTRFLGSGVQETRIVAEGRHPAIKIKDAKDCAISNVRVEGGIHCSNGELLVENCHIVAQQDGICIEAHNGSIITFSGMIRGEGGIAVRAMGESKVILKPPYTVSGEDYVVLDPKSSITTMKKSNDE